MVHSFQPRIAKEIGLHEALILNLIHKWNETEKSKLFAEEDGHNPLRITTAKIHAELTYLSAQKISAAMRNLSDMGVLSYNLVNKIECCYITEKGLVIINGGRIEELPRAKKMAAEKKLTKAELYLEATPEGLREPMEKWLEHRQRVKRMYSSMDGFKFFLENLIRISGNDMDIAEQMIKKAISEDWFTVYPLNNGKGVKSKETITKQANKWETF